MRERWACTPLTSDVTSESRKAAAAAREEPVLPLPTAECIERYLSLSEPLSESDCEARREVAPSRAAWPTVVAIPVESRRDRKPAAVSPREPRRLRKKTSIDARRDPIARSIDPRRCMCG